MQAVIQRWLRTAVATATVVAATSSGCGLTVTAPGDPTVAQVRTVADPATNAIGVSSDPRWPSSIANRKILDQYGDVYLMRTFSSWSLTDLPDSDITATLQGIAARGFNAVTVWAGGGYHVNGTWDSKYGRKANGDDWWSGAAWQSNLGPAWDAMDHVVAEARRLGLSVNFSFCGGFGDTGAGPDWEAASSTQMRDAGIAIAKRYPAAEYPNIVWHVMLDDGHAVDSTRGQRINALFDGINDTEGPSARPVRWLEPANGSSIAGQGWLRTGSFNATMNGWYSYEDNSAEIAEASYNEDLTVPTGDTEPPYDGSPHYPGNVGQQLRERSWATFIEGGAYINYGHEDWWPFGKDGLYSERVSWQDVPTHSHTVEQSYIWPVIDEYVADHSWEPDGTFLKTGTGSGDTKAAAGRSDTAAVAYVPSSRTVVVDTTVIAGTDPVRLRWYDPTTGRYIDISKSEARQTNRSVPYPSPHQDGTSDWVLVVDRATPSTPPSTTVAPTTTTLPPTTTVPPTTMVPPTTTLPPTTVALSTTTSTTVVLATSTSTTVPHSTSTSTTTSTTVPPSTTTSTTLPPTTVPTVPRSLAASSGNRAVRLTWSAPSSNGGAAISDYVVQRSADGGRTWRTINDGVSSARTAIVGGLTNGNRYGFRVVALNQVGRGPWSSPAFAVPATVSSAPRQLVATRAYRAAKLTWLAPWSNGGAAIRDYVVQRSADGGRTWRTVPDGVSTRRAAAAYGLTSSGRDRFRVSAVNRIGRGVWSAVVRLAQT